MNGIIERVREALEEVAEGTDGYELAAIMEPADVEDRWDILVAAPWIKGRMSFIEAISPILTPRLTDQEWTNWRGTVVLDHLDEFFHATNRLTGPLHEDRDLYSISIAGIPIRHAHIFALRQPEMAEAS